MASWYFDRHSEYTRMYAITVLKYVGPSLVDCIATVHYQRMALYEGRLSRAQKQNCICDFFRRAHPFHRCNLNGWLQSFHHSWRGGSHGRFDDARAHTIDAYSIIRVVNGIRSCHVDNGSLGGTVCGYVFALATDI